MSFHGWAGYNILPFLQMDTFKHALSSFLFFLILESGWSLKLSRSYRSCETMRDSIIKVKGIKIIDEIVACHMTQIQQV
jgi:hypothetical protein